MTPNSYFWRITKHTLLYGFFVLFFYNTLELFTTIQACRTHFYFCNDIGALCGYVLLIYMGVEEN